MLDPRRIEMLLAVVAHGSFAGAASALSFTPSAVSQQMRMLERDAGVQLFERSQRGVRLTAGGQALARRAETMRRELIDARAELDALAEAGAAQLMFGSFPTATAAFAARAIASYRRRHPSFALEVTDGEPYESVAGLRSRALDLAIVFELDSWPATRDYDGNEVVEADEVVLEPLFDDPFSLILPGDHPLAAEAGEVQLKQLTSERIIGSPLGCAPWGMDLEHVCEAAGVQLEFAAHYRSADFQAQQALVAAGLGVSLLPRLAQTALRDDVVVRPLMDAPVRRISLAWPAGAYRTPAAGAMADEVRAMVADARLAA
ncbi:MAG: LysR family transcriptional regulator [Thermoleophilaceae bacterium]|nr:LysR family transcriptional regulator [Thermoleophilaceae bacterium]